MGSSQRRCLKFFFTYPQSMLSKDGKLHRVCEVAMRADVVQDGGPYEVAIETLYASDLDKGAWFELHPGSESFRLPFDWLRANQEQMARLNEQWLSAVGAAGPSQCNAGCGA